MAVPSLITYAFLVASVRLVILHWYYYLALELPGCGRSVVTLEQAERLMRVRRFGIAEGHAHDHRATLLTHCARQTVADAASRQHAAPLLFTQPEQQ